MRWMDNLALLLCPARFLLGGWEWPNMLAASLYIVFCRRSSRSVKELQFFSLLYTTSSSCAQRSSFALPQAIGVFMLKPSRLEESLLFSEMWTSRVGVFLTGVQHLNLYNITGRNIFKDNLTIFHRSSSGHSWFRWCWNPLVEVTTKFQRYVLKMWIQNDGYNKCTGHKKVHSGLPGTWDKALDFYRFSKSAKIRLQLINLISYSSIGTYRGLRSGLSSINMIHVGSP